MLVWVILLPTNQHLQQEQQLELELELDLDAALSEFVVYFL